MKPQTQGVQAQFPQQMEVSTAKIKMSAHMVDLLSSKVYTDKQSAVIRELSCNAYDAQVVAGNGDKQIQVHLPTRFEPYFEVKDCGTGLSDEDVKNLYMTYGESTKQDSNDVVGFLGIGSKSPFAYVDAFTVTSIHEGIERQYSVFKDQGIPKVIKLSEIATTEPNGFSVKIPVKEQDYHDFRVKAQRIYKFFEVKPSVNVELDLEINKVVETDSYFTVENSSYNRKAYAIMGQVVYELPNTSQVGKLLRLIRGSVYVKFNIGDVSPAASREHLSNDESTSLVVEDELDKILTKYLETVQAEVDTCDNFRNAFELANQKIQDNDIVNSHITFEGKLKKEWFEIVKENIDNFKTDFPHATVYIKNSSWYGRVSWDKEDNPHVDIARVGYYKQSVLFMIKDLKSGGIQAFKNLLGNGNRFCTGIIVDSQAKVDAIVSKLHLTPELVTDCC
ncbi:MAG: hypothetical protein GWN01_15705 [Nitrosopumilaceae archaeon]|nr:hypothetical protein [Nitrosopumilaceae archaeon]NIU88739.1 hypothetical protein [Nitrosopumilaceae archaeon]NIV66874.1 hypothetical protein [Nitrosopumilaceae archaeon]NIX62888.1 hypothetical protein [Nitrosopumilaceae archaeon]